MPGRSSAAISAAERPRVASRIKLWTRTGRNPDARTHIGANRYIEPEVPRHGERRKDEASRPDPGCHYADGVEFVSPQGLERHPGERPLRLVGQGRRTAAGLARPPAHPDVLGPRCLLSGLRAAVPEALFDRCRR